MKRVKRPFNGNSRCLTCSKELGGRTDKFYCDDLCRAKFHNRRKSADERYLRFVNKILHKNREILKELFNAGGTTLRKDLLVQEGFNFDFFTQIKDLKGKTFKVCYEWGYYADYFGNTEICKIEEQSMK